MDARGNEKVPAAPVNNLDPVAAPNASQEANARPSAQAVLEMLLLSD